MTVQLALLNRSIEMIGSELVNCDSNCDGITNHIKNPKSNAPPRCLYFDCAGVSEEIPGVIVVGINPGTMKSEEKRFMDECQKEHGSISYEKIVEHWLDRGKNRKYYKHGKQVIIHINKLTANAWAGPVLWTELVKCQNDHNIKAAHKISKETYRGCVYRYLRREIEMMPRSYLMIAIGKDAYEALCYLCPDRPLLGIPHLTGSRNPRLLQDILAALESRQHWLTKSVSYTQQQADAKCRRPVAPACWLKTPGSRRTSST